MHEDSTAINPGSKDYTTQKVCAIQEFLDVQHAMVEQRQKSLVDNRFRCMEIPNGEPRVELIISTRDKVEISEYCKSILQNELQELQHTIVDNQVETKTQQFKSIQKKRLQESK